MNYRAENETEFGARTGLSGLGRLTAPAELSARLRVAASRVAQRRRRGSSPRAMAGFVLEQVGLWMNNLMKPLAVPFAGGLVSSIVLFGMLAPTLTVNRMVTSDVPIGITTPASLASSLSFDMNDPGTDVVIEVEIDEQGRVAGYSIPRGQRWASDPAMRRSVENTLLCTKFTPATIFGQPAAGRTWITLRRSSMDVRG